MFLFGNRYLLLDGNPDNPPGPPPVNPPPTPVDDQLSLDPEVIPPPVTTYSSIEYNKLLNANKALTGQRDDLKGQLKTNELSQMRDKEEWKEIAELKITENTELNQQLTSMKTAVVNKERMSAVRTAALQAGIRKEALDDLDFLDFPEVEIETTSHGNYNVIGAKTAIDSLKLKKPHWFGKKSGNLNGSLPEVTVTGNVTIDQIMKAEEKARSTSSPEAMAEYQRLTNLYNQQKRGK